MVTTYLIVLLSFPTKSQLKIYINSRLKLNVVLALERTAEIRDWKWDNFIFNKL